MKPLNGDVYDYKLDSEGRITILLMRPRGSVPGRGHPVIVRLDSDGSLDKAFGTVEFSSITPVAGSLAIDPVGNLLFAYPGENGEGHLKRLTASGKIDTSFGQDGTVDLNQFFDVANVGNNGDIWLVGYGPTVALLGSSGQLEKRFGAEGIARLKIPGFDDADDLFVQDDGQILVNISVRDEAERGGFDGYAADGLVRLTSDGQVDMSYGNGGSLLLAKSDSEELDSALVTKSNGRFLYFRFGRKLRVKSVARNGLARVHSTSTDTHFGARFRGSGTATNRATTRLAVCGSYEFNPATLGTRPAVLMTRVP